MKNAYLMVKMWNLLCVYYPNMPHIHEDNNETWEYFSKYSDKKSLQDAKNSGSYVVGLPFVIIDYDAYFKSYTEEEIIKYIEENLQYFITSI
jgi:hypothetical protein